MTATTPAAVPDWYGGAADETDWRCMFRGCTHGKPDLHPERYWSADWKQDSTAGSRVHCAVDLCSQECLDGWKAAGGPQQHLRAGPWPEHVVTGSYREIVPG